MTDYLDNKTDFLSAEKISGYAGKLTDIVGDYDAMLGALKDSKENPFATSYGQEVVSIGETANSRLYRVGDLRAAVFDATALVQDTVKHTIATISPTSGRAIKSIKVQLGATQATPVNILFYVFGTTGVTGEPAFYDYKVMNGTGSAEFLFDGELEVIGTGSISIGYQFIDSAVAGKFFGSYRCLEVAV